jgi:hypothetical protein
MKTTTTNKYNCEAGQAFVQVIASSHEESEEIAREKLTEMLLPHVDRGSDEWPSELIITDDKTGEVKMWDFLQ